MFLSLIEGIDESPPWSKFMADLAARTQARKAILLIHIANSSAEQEPTVVHVSAPRAVTEPALDHRRLTALGLHPYGKLRIGRVYGVEEMLNFDDKEILTAQRKALHDMGIGFGRWLRLSADGVADAWIMIVREREDFSSAAVAALSAIGPPLTSALRTFVALNQQRLQAAMAQSALRQLGIGQVALDANGRVMAADQLAANNLSFSDAPDGTATRRLLLPKSVQTELEANCAAMARAAAPSQAPATIRISETVRLLLKPWELPLPPGCTKPAAIGTLRLDHREDERPGAMLLRQLYDLSGNEAALAEKLSRGQTIVEAGQQLHLTDETARNYSKRLYAKTGARGQADLVRKILTGLAPLA